MQGLGQYNDADPKCSADTCLTLGRNGRDCVTLGSDLTSSERMEGGEERMEGGERSSSSSDASSGYCGSHQDLLLARAEVHPEPREASLPRRPTSSLSSFAPTNSSQSTSAPLRPEPPLHCSESPAVGPHQPHSTGPMAMCKRIPLQVLQGHQYDDTPLPDPPSFVDDYIERISAAQQVLRAFPPTAQSQVLFNWST